MTSSPRTIALLATLAAALVGCGDAGGENEFGAIDLTVEPAGSGGSTEPPTGYNGLRPSEFWSPTAQQAIRDLGHVALSSGGVVTLTDGTTLPVLPSIPSLDTLQSTYPEVMRHLIECTLEERDSVYDPINKRVLSGWWGLGTSWLAANLAKTDEQMFVTGCMIERLNVLGLHEEILFEGKTAAIEVNATYNPIYSYNESTAFGNMFISTQPITGHSPAFNAYICREDDLVATCGRNGGQPWIDKRICDNAASLCGLIDIGRCSSVCIKDGEHWQCPYPTGFFVWQTVGVQLRERVEITECN